MRTSLPINHKGWHDENPLGNYTLFLNFKAVKKLSQCYEVLKNVMKHIFIEGHLCAKY